MTETHPRTAALMARARAAQDADGRLAVPDVTTWDIFPFEGDLLVKRLEDPVLPEPPRAGEGGRDCRTCERDLQDAVWADERWKLVTAGPLAVPGLLLCPRAHHDWDDLPGDLLAELGPVLRRASDAVTALGGIGRVHLYKIGDGGAHLHWWVLARPAGVLQLRGSSLTDWEDCLPKMPADEWADVVHEVAVAMAAQGGTALR